jgi:SAM-dependent methyltransferase
MRLKVAGENARESLAIALNLAPVTIVDTHMAFMRARAIMVATRLGIFDALAPRPLDADAVARACNTVSGATRHLLNALTGAGYLHFANQLFSLRPIARKWLLADSPTSIRDKVLFEVFEWTIVEKLERFVTTGQAFDIHGEAAADSWGPYQRAMRALSGLAAPEIVRRAPVPPRAATMLDIGGSHGFISVAMCRRYPKLRAVVLDLPAAVRHAAPILAKEGMGDRVVHRAGDVLDENIGEAEWDFVYVSQLLHHFDEPASRALVTRIARALKPGGVLAVVELTGPSTPRSAGQVGALLDLYFALTSYGGTWSIDDVTSWERDAGLIPRRPITLRSAPGAVMMCAAKQG